MLLCTFCIQTWTGEGEGEGGSWGSYNNWHHKQRKTCVKQYHAVRFALLACPCLEHVLQCCDAYILYGMRGILRWAKSLGHLLESVQEQIWCWDLFFWSKRSSGVLDGPVYLMPWTGTDFLSHCWSPFISIRTCQPLSVTINIPSLLSFTEPILERDKDLVVIEWTTR